VARYEEIGGCLVEGWSKICLVE